MSNNTASIVDNTTATAVVTMVKNQLKNETGKYAAYVTENSVTVETVKDHVKALRELAYPGVKTSGTAPVGTPERDAKRFADKVRMGLNTALDAGTKERNKSDKYVTAEGLNAASWEEFEAKAKAEWFAANEK